MLGSSIPVGTYSKALLLPEAESLNRPLLPNVRLYGRPARATNVKPRRVSCFGMNCSAHDPETVKLCRLAKKPRETAGS